MSRVARLSLLLGLVAGCGNNGLPTDGNDGGADANHGLVSIAIAPGTATLAPGTQGTFTATGTNGDGSTLDLTKTATWSSSDPTVANGSAGVVSANRAGTATLTATMSGISGTAQVIVTNAKVTAIVLSPTSANLIVGATQAFSATASFSDGTQADVTHGAAWSSMDSSLAKVSMLGVATGVSAGSTAIVASFGGQGGSAQVTVSGKMLKSITVQPSNPTLTPHTFFHLNAHGVYTDGTSGDVSAIANWSSSMPAIVSVSAGGSANTIAEGVATITASVGGVSGSTTITVMAVKLMSISIVAVDGVILPPNGVAQLQAIGNYADGTKTDLTQSLTWASAAPATLTVSSTMPTIGMINGLVPGTATVTATDGVVTGTIDMVVSKAKLGSIELTLLDEVVPNGTVLHFTATGVYSDGTYVPLTHDVTWSTDDNTVATVSNVFATAGTGSTLMPGKVTITATFAGVSITTTLTVTAATLDSIAITPGNTTFHVGDQPALTATASYSDNTTSDVTALAVWGSSDGTIATVSDTGVLSAIGVGNTTITATFDKVTGNTSITVIMP